MIMPTIVTRVMKRNLRTNGALQLSLFDDRNMATITSPDFPFERLIVCRNPDLARARGRKRQDLLTATERDLTHIAAAVGRRRQPLRGAAEIGIKVGAVLDKHKMAKHFDLTITDDSLSFARNTAAIAAEAMLDGIYVVRTSLPADTLDEAGTCARLQITGPRRARLLLPEDRRSPGAAHLPLAGRPAFAPTSSCACSPTTSNGRCAPALSRCSTTMPIKKRPRPIRLANSDRCAA